MKIYYYIYSLRIFQKNQETTMISYAKYKTFWKFPQLSQFSWMILEPAQSFYMVLKGKF